MLLCLTSLCIPVWTTLSLIPVQNSVGNIKLKFCLFVFSGLMSDQGETCKCYYCRRQSFYTRCGRGKWLKGNGWRSFCPGKNWTEFGQRTWVMIERVALWVTCGTYNGRSRLWKGWMGVHGAFVLVSKVWTCFRSVNITSVKITVGIIIMSCVQLKMRMLMCCVVLWCVALCFDVLRCVVICCVALHWTCFLCSVNKTDSIRVSWH